MTVPNRLQRLQEHARTLGLRLMVAPSREETLSLPDIEGIRDSVFFGKTPPLPWMLHAERDAREVAVFQHPLVLSGSVFAARTPHDGPLIRVEDARAPARQLLSTGFAFVIFAAGAVYGFAMSSMFFAAMASFVAFLAAWQLCLYLGAWLGGRQDSKTDTTRVDFDDPAFSKIFRVRSNDHDIARAILTSPVRQRMLATPGARCWTVGHGWVSALIRSKPVPPRTFGMPLRKGMPLHELGTTIDAVARVAHAIEDAAGSIPPRPAPGR